MAKRITLVADTDNLINPTIEITVRRWYPKGRRYEIKVHSGWTTDRIFKFYCNRCSKSQVLEIIEAARRVGRRSSTKAYLVATAAWAELTPETVEAACEARSHWATMEVRATEASRLEQLQCADDCRRLLPVPVLNFN